MTEHKYDVSGVPDDPPWKGNGNLSNGDLASSKRNLFRLIRKGIPPRDYLQASEGMLVRGKRHQLAAPRRAGKSLAMFVHFVDMVLAGATIVILDRENGQDEYARRLADISAGRGLSDEQIAELEARLMYFEFPHFHAGNGDGAEAAELFDSYHADLVLFDAQRMFLSDLGLDEDSSDDYARFVTELIEPLWRAGIATMILDNTGHGDVTRARGTSSKGDLNEVLFTAEVTVPFARDKAGALTLKLEPGQSRFGNTGEWVMKLGDGNYSSWEPLGVVPAKLKVRDTDDVARELVLTYVRENPGVSRRKVREVCKGKGAGGERLNAVMKELIRTGDLRLVDDQKLYVAE